MAAFKNQIFLYGMGVALIFEAVSLLFLGLDGRFAYGLALGTAVSIVNFSLLDLTLRRVLLKGAPSLAVVGYVIRLGLYGFAFYMAIRAGRTAGAGALLGFLSLKAAIYYLHGFKSKFSKGRKLRPEEPPSEKKRKGFLRGVFDWPDDEDSDRPADGETPPADGERPPADGRIGAAEAGTETTNGPTDRVRIKGKTYTIRRRRPL